MDFLIDLFIFGSVAVVMVTFWCLISYASDQLDARRQRKNPVKFQLFEASRDAYLQDLLADDRKRTVMNQMRDYKRQSR